MRPPSRRACALLASAALITGCGSADEWSAPRAQPTAVGTLGPGFVDPDAPPAPEATITPRPGSWDAVHPPEGYRVVLVTAGESGPTRTLTGAVRRWADQEKVSLRTVTATAPDQDTGRLVDAIDLAPDLIICAGDQLIDPAALVTASHLDQQFLVLGAELPEPTGNVTAANWTGASFRGAGLGMASAYDPTTFTAERAGRALRAGVAAVLNDLTGIVIRLA